MKRSSESIHSTSGILEALTESILEIDSQYQKVQQLKKLLLANNKPTLNPALNSYAAKYLMSHKKNTMSMKNLQDPSPILKKSVSIKDLNEKAPADESEIFISSKENEIKKKAEEVKNDEKLVFELEKQAKFLENELKTIEKKKNVESQLINSQISFEFCRNIVHETLLSALNTSFSNKSKKIQSQKPSVLTQYTQISILTTEIEKLRKEIHNEWQDFQKAQKKLQAKERILDQNLEKLINDSKSLQESRQSLTLRQREEQLKIKESAVLARLKALNQQKAVIEAKSQKLSLINKSSAKSFSVRESKLLAKEAHIAEVEAFLEKDELETEEKRNKVMGKWEKMISKVDDVNKQEHKNSCTNQELEDRYKEFALYKKEWEQKLNTQETLLINQETNLLRKIAKLEEGFNEVQMDSLEENVDEDFGKQFIQRQNLRKKELEELSKEKKQISLTLSSFLSELN